MNKKKVLLSLGLILGLMMVGCVHTSTSNRSRNSEQSYYLYDFKYGGYPTGRIEKNGNTYYIYDTKYGGYPTGRIEKKGNSYYRYDGKYGGYPVGMVKKK
jgi:hypothetical protein